MGLQVKAPGCNDSGLGGGTKAFLHERPNLVVLDLMLPNMDG